MESGLGVSRSPTDQIASLMLNGLVPAVFLVLIADLAEDGDATQNGVACLERGDEVVRVVIDAVADIPGAVDTRLQRQPAEILAAAQHREAAMRRVVCGRARSWPGPLLAEIGSSSAGNTGRNSRACD